MFRLLLADRHRLASFMLSLSLSSLALTSTAAANGPYVSIGGEVGSYENQTPTGSYTDVAINARIGFDFFTYVGIEAEGALNLGGAATFMDMTESGSRMFEDDVTSRVGVFLRGRAPVSDRWEIFGRGGFGIRNARDSFRSVGVFQFNGEPFDMSSDMDRTDPFFAIGGGTEYNLSEDGPNAIRAEFTLYRTYIGGEDQDTDFASDSVFSVAYVRRF